MDLIKMHFTHTYVMPAGTTAGMSALMQAHKKINTRCISLRFLLCLCEAGCDQFISFSSTF
jgi:hypothetical protein